MSCSIGSAKDGFQSVGMNLDLCVCRHRKGIWEMEREEVIYLSNVAQTKRYYWGCRSGSRLVGLQI